MNAKNIIDNTSAAKMPKETLEQIKKEILIACTPDPSKRSIAILEKYFKGPTPILDPNTLITPNFTALMACAYYKFTDGAKLMIKLGAKINIANPEGLAPLHIATQMKSPNICLSLLKNNANVDQKTKKLQTSLMFACQGGDEEIVDLLLNKRPDIMAQDANKKVCLDYARENEHYELIKKINYIVFQEKIPLNNIHKDKASSKI